MGLAVSDDGTNGVVTIVFVAFLVQRQRLGRKSGLGSRGRGGAAVCRRPSGEFLQQLRIGEVGESSGEYNSTVWGGTQTQQETARDDGLEKAKLEILRVGGA